MSSELGQPVIVENRPGFATLIAMEAVAKAAPDGYTLGMGVPANLASHPRLFDRRPYNVDGLMPISMPMKYAWVMYVNSTVPAKSLAEFVALAKAKPDLITYASTGIGSFNHLTGEWFQTLTGTKIRHIPYVSTGFTADFIGGQVDMVQWPLSGMVDHVKSGKARALAISNGTIRSAQLPDVPIFAESGLPQFEVSAWAGLVAPPGTPQEIIDRLAAAAIRAARSAAFAEHVGLCESGRRDRERDGRSPATADPEMPGLSHAAFRIGETLDDLREFKSHLERLGIPILRIRDHAVSQSIYVADPDGIVIEGYAATAMTIGAGDPPFAAISEPLVLE